jgi:hypothetical protein
MRELGVAWRGEQFAAMVPLGRYGMPDEGRCLSMLPTAVPWTQVLFPLVLVVS